MMYGDGVDIGHRCLRWMVRLDLGQGKALSDVAGENYTLAVRPRSG
jgi:hypothetical protein